MLTSVAKQRQQYIRRSIHWIICIPSTFSRYFLSGLVLSSTMLNLDSCLYARNTINAIMRKSIMFAMRSPNINVELPTVNLAAFKFPAGMNSPISGVMISLTNAVTRSATWRCLHVEWLGV